MKGEKEMFTILIVAWILTWFDIDNLVIDGLNQILNTNFTTAVYWLFFFIIAVISLLKEVCNEI